MGAREAHERAHAQLVGAFQHRIANELGQLVVQAALAPSLARTQTGAGA